MAIALGVLAVIIVLVGLAVVIVIAKNSSSQEDDEPALSKGAAPQEKPRMKHLLTAREKEMFSRLTQAFPGMHVLAQVSGGALLEATHRGVRNKFDRKQIDFVLLMPDYSVLAVIELDDRSHRSKASADADRDDMFLQAGYSVMRLANVPDATELRALVAKINKPGTMVRG